LPGLGYGTAPTNDGRFLLVVVPEKNTVAVVDLVMLKVVKTISVPAMPQEVIVRPDGKVAYVSLSTSHQVAAIDVAGLKVQGLIEVGNWADGMAWAK
jgi:DNA-binding beta-propeller fold protein YncE